MELAKLKCEACRKGAPHATESERAEYLQQLPDWKILQRNGVDQLERSYAFDDFSQALAFTIRIGELSEQEFHHPSILTEWGRVTVTWWTHKIKGLHRNDFIMAARTDELYGR